MRVIVLFVIIQCLWVLNLPAQVYSDKLVGKKSEALKDSIESTPYPYALPIWGAKAAELGFDLPYSAGISVNYFTQRSDLVINNLMAGFNNGPMYNLDEIVRFNEAVSEASVVNVRPDIWLFPFLNIYGILSKSKTSTAIDASFWLPDSSNVWSEVANLKTKANFDGSTFGFGMTPTIGVGGGWFALDMNVAWTDVSALDRPVFTFLFGPRLGKTFRFKNPEQNISFWVGGFRVKFSSSTTGSLPLNELFDIDEIQNKVDNGIDAVGEKQMNVDEWWNDLSEIEQNNPVNKARYNAANRALDAAGNVLSNLDAALNDEQTASVQYSLDKDVKDKWNFIVGSQFQLNKHIMLRAEYGFLGSRTQFLGSVQYRFGL